MGMCKPSGGVNEPVYGPFGKNIKDIEGCPPNSRTDYFDENGELIQQRWYGPDGRAIWNIDWKHPDTNTRKPHKFPHDHYWDWEKNKEHPPRIEYKGPNGEKTNKNYC